MSENKTASPKIISLKWGRMEIEKIGRGKDFRLWPGGGGNWDWQENGTRHSPGIQIADCEELISKGSRVVVLSRGMFSRLKVPQQTVSFLEENGIEAIVADTKKAVKIYNSLVDQGKKVGGVFHSTC